MTEHANLRERYPDYLDHDIEMACRMLVLRDVRVERDRQNEKWGGVQDLDDAMYLAVATEELGEAAQALLHNRFGGHAAGTLRTELVQLAAVVVQWVQWIDMKEATRE